MDHILSIGKKNIFPLSIIHAESDGSELARCSRCSGSDKKKHLGGPNCILILCTIAMQGRTCKNFTHKGGDFIIPNEPVV